MSRRVERLVGHLDGSAASAEGVDPYGYRAACAPGSSCDDDLRVCCQEELVDRYGQSYREEVPAANL